MLLFDHFCPQASSISKLIPSSTTAFPPLPPEPRIPPTAYQPHHVLARSAIHHHHNSSHGRHTGDRLRRYVSPAQSLLEQPPTVCLIHPSIAYAIYFDHKRQTDPEFRKALKRESRREARIARTQAEAHGAQQKEAIKAAVDAAKEEGFPTDVEDKEAFFMTEVARGETLCQDGM